MFTEKIKRFLTNNSNENMIKIIFVFLNSYNLYYFINNSKYTCINTILLFLMYFYISNTSNKNKIKLLLICLVFSLFTLLTESYIIYKTKGKNISYNKPDMLNVNGWLFTAYVSMIFNVIILNELLNLFLT